MGGDGEETYFFFFLNVRRLGYFAHVRKRGIFFFLRSKDWDVSPMCVRETYSHEFRMNHAACMRRVSLCYSIGAFLLSPFFLPNVQDVARFDAQDVARFDAPNVQDVANCSPASE